MKLPAEEAVKLHAARRIGQLRGCGSVAVLLLTAVVATSSAQRPDTVATATLSD